MAYDPRIERFIEMFELRSFAAIVGLEVDDLLRAFDRDVLQPAFQEFRRNGFDRAAAIAAVDHHTEENLVITVIVKALEHAGRQQDAQFVRDLRRTALLPLDTSAPAGLGAPAKYHADPHVQRAIRILTSAGLEPAQDPGAGPGNRGFFIVPVLNVPGRVIIRHDADAPQRQGMTGGDQAYVRLMILAGWLRPEILSHPNLTVAQNMNVSTASTADSNQSGTWPFFNIPRLPVDRRTFDIWCAQQGMAEETKTVTLKTIPSFFFREKAIYEAMGKSNSQAETGLLSEATTRLLIHAAALVFAGRYDEAKALEITFI